MKKFILLLFLPVFTFAQVGVNKIDPQQTLHIGEADASIKIDGLSEQNNPKNLGVGSKTRVFVDPDGDLVLGDTEDNIIFILDQENYIPDNMAQKVVQTGNGDNFTKITISQYNFPDVIMGEDGIMEINYSLSWIIERNSQNKVSDGAARTIRTIVYIRDADSGEYLQNGNGTDLTFGKTGQFYSNSSTTLGADRYFYNTGTDYVQVPAGNYEIIFGALVMAGPNSDNIQIWVGGKMDQVQVIAHY